MIQEKLVMLIDGGFLKRKLRANRQFPTSVDIRKFCDATLAKSPLKDLSLLRIYYYDADPLSDKVQNPISRQSTDFSKTQTYTNNKTLIQNLELEPDFAIRRGRLAQHGWVLKPAVVEDLIKGRRSGPITAADIQPSMEQKLVDIKIGLDIAWIALRGLAHHLVLVTGDSDFIPVMKFARKEGMRVYLECLGHGVYRDLKVHADIVL